jgi:hypothetical protein
MMSPELREFLDWERANPVENAGDARAAMVKAVERWRTAADSLQRGTQEVGTLTEAQKRFIELDRRKAEYKQFLEDYKAAAEAVVAESGIGAFFQDDEGIVYQTAVPDGRFVYYERFCINRTRREGEKAGSLSQKAAREAGFSV